MRFNLLFVVGMWGLLSASVVAQDLTVQSPTWVDENDAPDKLPVLDVEGKTFKARGGLAELDSPVYRETVYYVGDEKDPEAISIGIARGSVFLSEDTQNVSAKSWSSPAHRDGRPVVSEVKVVEIFNPKSADSKSSDASARLLHVVPAIAPDDETEKSPIDAIIAELSIDAEGRVTHVSFPETAPANYSRAAERAALKWSFAPARANGSPVPSTVVIPVLFTRVAPLNPNKVQVPPRVKKQSKPDYPVAMHRANIEGKVLVAFVVGVEGRTRDIYALQSNNPLFEEAAIDAVARWTFEPGKVNGRAVNTRMSVPIIFNIQGGGNSMFTVKRPKKFPESLPEAFHYDRPPTITQMALPTYPFAALRDGIEGKVTVNFIISPTGQIEKAVVRDPQGLDIEEAARTAVELFEFQPALKNGKPGYALIGMELDFKKNGRGDVEVSNETKRLLKLLENSPVKLARLADLDSIPRALSRRPPTTPLELRQAGATGEALIEFVIDRRGFARLPRVISTSDPAYGFAAVQAISSWRFESPKLDGKVVDAIARIPVQFNFEAPK